MGVRGTRRLGEIRLRATSLKERAPQSSRERSRSRLPTRHELEKTKPVVVPVGKTKKESEDLLN